MLRGICRKVAAAGRLVACLALSSPQPAEAGESERIAENRSEVSVLIEPDG